MLQPSLFSDSSTSCFKSNLKASNEEEKVQYNIVNANDDKFDDSSDDSTEIQWSLEHHEKPKSLTTELPIIVNISNTEVTKEMKIGANLSER